MATTVDQLRHVVRTCPVIDNHAHNLLRLEQLRKSDFVTITTEAHGDALEDTPKSLAHIRAARQLRQLYGLPADADWKDLDEEIGNGTVFRKFFGNRRTFLVWSKEGWVKLLKTGGFDVVDAVLSPFQPEADCDLEPHYFITARRS